MKDVTSEEGLENPHSPGTLWDRTKTSVADFWEYLRGVAGADGQDGADGKDGADGQDGADGKDGADGQDGTDGMSAYELWKSMVLSETGLPNPGNGVYDIELYPNWPAFAVSENDFWLYLKGKDGSEGQTIIVTRIDSVIVYVDDIDPQKYSVKPVRALLDLADSTYEYVNPYTGGVSYVVFGPGPVLIPDATVELEDGDGKTYSWNSDQDACINLDRNALPDWTEGSPADGIGLTVRSITFGEKTISESDRLENTILPYKVTVSCTMDAPTLEYGDKARLSFKGFRIREGVSSPWPDGKRYEYVMSDYDLLSAQALLPSYSKAIEKVATAVCHTEDFSDYGSVSPLTYSFVDGLEIDRLISVRPVSDDGQAIGEYLRSPLYSVVSLGDAASDKPSNPSVLPLHSAPLYKDSKEVVELSADYGMRVCSFDTDSKVAVIPEICRMGDLDVTSTFTEDTDADNPRVLHWTRYRAKIGETNFYGKFDMSTFGHVYSNRTFSESGSGLGNASVSEVYAFKEYSSLDALISSGEAELAGEYSSFMISGVLSGVKISNSVKTEYDKPFNIKNLYDGFSVYVGGVYMYHRGQPFSVYASRSGSFYYSGQSTSATLKWKADGYPSQIQTVDALWGE